MRHAAAILLLSLFGVCGAQAREVVTASAPDHVAVTVYRDPDRSAEERMNPDWPEGFAMISETRTVTLPAGPSTIRFEGVAEGMAAVTAIVTGLPGGVIEKNRNADLLSPAALVDGTLGNRVTITRTNPATGKETSENAVVRTRADGGLVLQTREGFEAVRCSGLPERLGFERIPAGLSAQPVFSIDTAAPNGGTYRVTLTYLAAGFDWQAHYVATFQDDQRGSRERQLHLLSWLTVANDNGQSFGDAELMAVAGKLNVQSDMRDLAAAPQARPLRLTCYPLGSTSDGSPPPPPPPPPMVMFAPAPDIVVTAQRRSESLMNVPVAMIAKEEALGDLKLFRVPEPVTLSAKSLKQVAFLNKGSVTGNLIYVQACRPEDDSESTRPFRVLFQTRNDKRHGLGDALPMGGMTVFEPARRGDQLIGETSVRDYAVGQDMELNIARSPGVFAQCTPETSPGTPSRDRGISSPNWSRRTALLSNATAQTVKARLVLGSVETWNVDKRLKGLAAKDGEWIVETTVPANGMRRLTWNLRPISP